MIGNYINKKIAEDPAWGIVFIYGFGGLGAITITALFIAIGVIE